MQKSRAKRLNLVAFLPFTEMFCADQDFRFPYAIYHRKTAILKT